MFKCGVIFNDGPGVGQIVIFENLLMPLFLMGCFPLDFHEVKRPLRTKSGKRPIKAGKRPIKEAKRPIKAMVLVGISVGCLMGCFRAPQPCRKTAPLKRPIKRSMTFLSIFQDFRGRGILYSLYLNPFSEPAAEPQCQALQIDCDVRFAV